MSSLISLIHFCFSIIFLVSNVVHALKSEGIVGGDDAAPGTYTYHATLVIKNKMCAAGIISPQHIVTTAYCVVDPDTYTFWDFRIRVVVGTNDLNTADGYRQDVLAEKYYVPQKYFAMRYIWTSADIAVVKLSQTLTLDPNRRVTSLKLPSPLATFGSTYLVVTGAGVNEIHFTTFPNKTINVTGTSSLKVRHATARLYSRDECHAAAPKTTEFVHLCAKLVMRSSWYPEGLCRGDSGAPLVHSGNTILGVLTMTPNDCNETFKPSIYTSTQAWGDFIKRSMNDKCKDIDIVCYTPSK